MHDLKDYYAERVRSSDRQDYLSQVGHTLHGRPISESQFRDLLDQIVQSLQPTGDDTVLDLCCGNGLFTAELGRRAKAVVGVDLSADLIDIARADHAAANIEYHCGNVLEVGRIEAVSARRFDKVMMYAALQHFTPADLDALLRQLVPLLSEHPILYLGFVPDRQRIWNFYNTPRRKARYLLGRILGKDALGHWWTRGEIETVCALYGLRCRFQSVPEGLHASIYRFNVVISRAGPGA